MNNIITNINNFTNLGVSLNSKAFNGERPIKTSCHEYGSAETKKSFKTYGNHKERLAIVARNSETGMIIYQIPSKEIQELHIQLKASLNKNISEKA
jgi:hypothetical protein